MATNRTKRDLQSELDVESIRRVAAEDELWLHNRAMDYAENGIIITDNNLPDNPIIYANRAFLQLTGYTLDEVMHRNCRFLQGPDTNIDSITQLRASIEHKTTAKVIIRNYRKTGEAFWNELSIAPVPGIDGEITHFIGAQIDVTERINREEELARQVDLRTIKLQKVNERLEEENRRRQDIESELMSKQRQLEFSNYELEQFATVASHDLHEPLRMVSSYLSLIERRYGKTLDSDGVEFLDYALDGAQRMKRLIQDLAVYARFDREEAKFMRIDLNEVVQDAINDQRLRIAETNAAIEMKNLTSLNGDRTQLTQVFQNLISNALRYRGDQLPKICITEEQIDDETIISVNDNGIGIAPRDHERIFLVFRQVDRSSRSDGSGIGLAIAKKIVIRHGGRIWVESKLGHGSTFKLAFPRNNQEHHSYARQP